MSVTILKALEDRRLFASALRDKATWRPWRAFLAALFGLPMSEDEAELFRQCTGRAAPPLAAFVEAWLICGRRSGKSFILALTAVYLGALRDYRPYLGPGERATIVVVAADRRQARVIMRYVKGLLAIPALAKLVESETAKSIELRQSVTIEVGTASHRTIRGYSVAAALCDELAFWPQEDSQRPTSRYWRPCGRRWRQFRTRCFSARRARMRAAARCSKRSAAISASTIHRCSSGRRRRAP